MPFDVLHLPAWALLPAALSVAWTLDLAIGEPPNAWHPVAWLGHVLGRVGRALSRWRPAPAFIGGALAWWALAAVLATVSLGLEQALAAWPAGGGWAAACVLGLLLKPCFAWRMLHDEVQAVEQALATSLPAGRDRVARLASRDVCTLDASQVRETAIETLAENLNDSVVAPLFWYAVAGLPGAVVYRLANTADAMWGYRGRFEWAGKWAARADDVLLWLPARLTALLLMTATAWGPGRPGFRALRAEAAQTPSPNGGWPMGAMALRLGVRLRKPGVYALNAAAAEPAAEHTGRALRLACSAAWAAAGWAVLATALTRWVLAGA